MSFWTTHVNLNIRNFELADVNLYIEINCSIIPVKLGDNSLLEYSGNPTCEILFNVARDQVVRLKVNPPITVTASQKSREYNLKRIIL